MRYCCILLVGWYLLMPGASPNGQHPSQRPMKEWFHLESFDTAFKCQLAKARWKRGYEKQGDGDMAEWVSQGRCVATDDPRLTP